MNRSKTVNLLAAVIFGLVFVAYILLQERISTDTAVAVSVSKLARKLKFAQHHHKIKVVILVQGISSSYKLLPVAKGMLASEDLLPIVISTSDAQDMCKLFAVSPDIMLGDISSLSHYSPEMVNTISTALEGVNPAFVLVAGASMQAKLLAMLANNMNIKVVRISSSPIEDSSALDYMADVHFSPSIEITNGILKYGVPKSNIIQSGSPVLDSANYLASIATLGSEPWHADIEKAVFISISKFNDFLGLTELIVGIAQNFTVLINSNNCTENTFALLEYPTVHIMSPDTSQDMLAYTLKHCKLLLTDSYTIQQAAAAFSKHKILVGNASNAPEFSSNVLASFQNFEKDEIIGVVRTFMENGKQVQVESAYGNGEAALAIINYLRNPAAVIEQKKAHIYPSSVALVTYYAPKTNDGHRIWVAGDVYEDLSQKTLTNIAAYTHSHGIPFFFQNQFLVKTDTRSPYWVFFF